MTPGIFKDMTVNRQPSVMFSRQFDDSEWQTYQKAITRAKKVLNKDRLAIITPIRSLPLDKEDVGWGNMLGAQGFLSFVKKLGFDTLQVDPAGALLPDDISPYSSTMFSYNPLQIDLHALTTPAYGSLLTTTDIQSLSTAYKESERSSANRTWREATHKDKFDDKFHTVLKMAFKNYKTYLPPHLSRQINQFKLENQSWLEKDALYEILSTKVYPGKHDWQNWTGQNADLDKTLLSGKGNKKSEARAARLAELNKTYKDDLDFYQFTQAIAGIQFRDAREKTDKLGINVFGDRQIGFSKRDEWAYQDVIMPGWYVGAPADYACPTMQNWGFPVIHPNTIFGDNGQVDLSKPGAKLLYNVFDKMFKDFRGIRIDHINGLIDPWVYKPPENFVYGPHLTETGKQSWCQGRLYSSPDIPELAEFSKIGLSDIQTNQPKYGPTRIKETALKPALQAQYESVLKNIVLKVAKDNGLSATDIIAEDIGSASRPVAKAMQNLKLPGIRVLQYLELNNRVDQSIHVGKNQTSNNWFTLGNHDNANLRAEMQSTWKEDDGQLRRAHAQRLKQQVYRNNKLITVDALVQNDDLMMKGFFTELFASKAKDLLVFFPDMYGMTARYNRPGISNHSNPSLDDELWTMRIPQRYEQAYFENVQAGKALNLPEQLLDTLATKGTFFIIRNIKLYYQLKSLANILKAPEKIN